MPAHVVSMSPDGYTLASTAILVVVMELLFGKTRRLAGVFVLFMGTFLVAAPAVAEFGFSGMHVQGVNTSIAKALGLLKAEGVMVMDVALGGPADFAGVKRGDRITKFHGTHIDTFKCLVKVVTGTKPGQTIALHVIRATGEFDLKLKLGTKPVSWKIAKEAVINFPAIGITLAAITQKIRQRFKIRWGSVGVLVTLIDPELASRMLLNRGDVIVQLNQKDVWLPSQVLKAYNKAKVANVSQMLMLIERPDGFRYMMLPVK